MPEGSVFVLSSVNARQKPSPRFRYSQPLNRDCSDRLVLLPRSVSWAERQSFRLSFRMADDSLTVLSNPGQRIENVGQYIHPEV